MGYSSTEVAAGQIKAMMLHSHHQLEDQLSHDMNVPSSVIGLRAF